MHREIRVKGARQHNLKNIDLSIPRDRLVVFTGVSGSGKSSLAFDTLYAEGQRRYVESLSSYARQFLGQLEKPQVDHVDGLSPAISIDQKAPSRNPRSTVGTVTEIMDYLRVLYARLGVQHCHVCGREVGSQSPQQMAERLQELPEGTRLLLFAPMVRGRKGEYRDLITRLKSEGFVRLRIDGALYELDAQDAPRLSKTMSHDVEALVDRVVVGRAKRSRLVDSIETALRLSGGNLLAETTEGEQILLGEDRACVHCGISFEELAPQHFSFNSPRGACPRCNGLGTLLTADPERLITDPDLSINEGAVAFMGALAEKETLGWWTQKFLQIADHYGIDLDRPWRRLPKKHREVLLYGDSQRIRYRYEGQNFKGDFEGEVVGVANEVERLVRQTRSERRRRYYAKFLHEGWCPSCEGSKLRPESLAVRMGGLDLAELGALSIREACAFFENIDLPAHQRTMAQDALREVRDRLGFLLDVGLDYLTLDRSAPSLSGGESQRIRLASQIGSALVGVLYILDEPSIGLHQRDNGRLLRTLESLRDMGNTVVVVEHDEETIEAADHVVDFGPGAGIKGGEIVFQGTVARLRRASKRSLTGAYLSGDLDVVESRERRSPPRKWLGVKGARHHNLKKVDARFPLGLFTCVTGVSGSGKSSLVNETLYPALARDLHGAMPKIGAHSRITGLSNVDKVIDINQDPIGRTPRSNPATYVKVFDLIRQIFAQLPLARARGYSPGRFSFNVKGGRCEACEGHGQKKIEMHFLSDVWVTCEVCKGRRFNEETREVRYRGKSITDVLEMDVQEALEFFGNHPRIRAILQTLHDVGLDYLKLGQPATTLSGGEAQRIKLSRELARRATGRTVYILDEPTTGLHFHDVKRLLEVLHRLVDGGNTVIVIEHNLDVVRSADWIVDLGPEGGEGGGFVVAAGTPEEVAAVDASHTGRYLRPLLRSGRSRVRRATTRSRRARRATG
ncbi:MAG TPA: excinuclease ABC subunit UvrA [Candidatus Krumholzibacteria bacterium]|nr:excinuclease ABC subunit UvrA [Candidatus Krumholzibacteria bacterium]